MTAPPVPVSLAPVPALPAPNPRLRVDDSDHTRKLFGSPLLDAFKFIHKEAPGFYASDLDLALVEEGDPHLALVEQVPEGVAAFLEVKRKGERFSFAQITLLNQSRQLAPVYVVIVRVDPSPYPDFPRGGPVPQVVIEYLGGSRGPRGSPSSWTPGKSFEVGDWKGFWKWERELRGSYRRAGGGPGWHLRPSAPFGTSAPDDVGGAPDGVRAMDTDEPHALGGADDDQDEVRADVEEEWAKVLAKEGARFPRRSRGGVRGTGGALPRRSGGGGGAPR